MKALVLALLLSGCLSLPEPVQFDGARTDGGSLDAGADAGAGDARVGPYTGPCTEVPSFAGRGVNTLFFSPGTRASQNVSFTSVSADIPGRDGGTDGILNFYLVGERSGLEGMPVDLSAFGQRDLRTCTHCLMMFRDCNGAFSGPDCDNGPYLPRSGRAIASGVPMSSADPLYIEFADVELHRATVDTVNLETVELAEDPSDCLYIRRAIYWASVEEIDCLGLDYLCPIQSR